MVAQVFLHVSRTLVSTRAYMEWRAIIVGASPPGYAKRGFRSAVTGAAHIALAAQSVWQCDALPLTWSASSLKLIGPACVGDCVRR